MVDSLNTAEPIERDPPLRSSPFSIVIPINYEDTDAGGIVYYGNYLGYMERARNACLRELGFPLGELVNIHKLLFVVADVHIKYRQPARLDDELQITLAIKRAKGASIEFRQTVLRDTALLVEADLKLAIINSETFKPRKLPEFLKSGLCQWMLPDKGSEN